MTKRLGERVFSNAHLPRARLHPLGSRVRGWEGRNAGRRRGAAVDRQLTAVANGRSKLLAGDAAWSGKSAESPFAGKGLYRLTALALAFLRAQGLRPVCGQRGVRSASKGVATAVDLVCFAEQSSTLWLIEVKCGFDGTRRETVASKGNQSLPRSMRGALKACHDTHEHRHLAQLAATTAMFEEETETTKRLRSEFGVRRVRACLLYLTDETVEAVPLPAWWRRVGPSLV